MECRTEGCRNIAMATPEELYSFCGFGRCGNALRQQVRELEALKHPKTDESPRTVVVYMDEHQSVGELAQSCSSIATSMVLVHGDCHNVVYTDMDAMWLVLSADRLNDEQLADAIDNAGFGRSDHDPLIER